MAGCEVCFLLLMMVVGSVQGQAVRIPPPGVLIVGQTATLTCSSDLAISMIVWADVMGGHMTTENDTAVLTFDPITDDLDGAVLTCIVTATNTSVFTSDVTLSVEAYPAARAHIYTADNSTAGSMYTLTCYAVVVLEYRGASSTVVWLDPMSYTISRSDITVGKLTSHYDFYALGSFYGVYSLTLLFSPLHTSHGGQFICRATAHIPNVLSYSDTKDVIVEIEPAITFSSSSAFSDLSMPYSGVLFTLTCTIELGPAVDTDVTITQTLTRDGTTVGGPSSVTGRMHSLSLEFEPLSDQDVGEYTCTALIAATTSSMFVMGGTFSASHPIAVQHVVQITTHPSDQLLVVPGTEVTFTVTARGNNLTYEWKRVGGLLPSSASGANTSTLTISNVMEIDGGMYQCIVSSFVNADISNPATLTLLDPPTISSGYLLVVPGATVAFTITATGNNLTYQWQKGTVNVTGATANSYTISDVVEEDEGLYQCVVSNAAGRAIDSITVLSVLDPPVLTGPRNIVVGVTQSATLTCSAHSNSTATFTWSGPMNLTGLVTESLSGPLYTSSVTVSSNFSELRNGEYCCNASNDAGVAPTQCATLLDVEITVADQKDIDIGSAVTFICNATGFENIFLTFSWRRSSNTLENDNRVFGADTELLMITNVALTDEGIYECIVNFSDSEQRSAGGMLTVLRPNVSIDPSTGTVKNATETLVLVCNATNTQSAPHNLTFYWYFQTENSILESGDRDGRVSITNTPEDTGRQAVSILTVKDIIKTGDSGKYACLASNRERADASQAASVVIVISPPGNVDRTTVTWQLLSFIRVLLSWDAVEENNAPVTYLISYCRLMNNNESSVCGDSFTESTNESYFTFSGLIFNQWYAINITAVNDAGSSNTVSAPIIKTANEDNATAVNFHAVVATSNQILLSWNIPHHAIDCPDDVVINSSSLIYRSVQSGLDQVNSVVIPYSPLLGVETSTLQTVYLASGLAAGVNYHFKVTIIYSKPNITSSSNMENFSTQVFGYTPDLVPMMNSIRSDEIILSWTASESDRFIQQYQIDYTSISDNQRRNDTVAIFVKSTFGTITGLTPFTMYEVQVLGNYQVNGERFQAPVTAAVRITTAESIPTAPQNIRTNGNPTFDTISLTWDPPIMPNGAIQSYDVYFQNIDETSSPVVPRQGITSTQIEITGLDYLTNYSIAVQARTSPGPGDTSDSVIIATSFGVYMPSLIFSDAMNIVQGQINVTVTYSDEQGPISHYKVIVVTDLEVNTDTISDDDLIHRAGSDAATQLGFYTAITEDIDPLIIGRVTKHLVVGDGNEPTTSTDVENNTYFYDNPMLNPERDYIIFMRVYSRVDVSVSSDSFQLRINGAVSSAGGDLVVIIVGTIGGVVLLFICILVMIVIIIRVRKRTKTMHIELLQLPSSTTSHLRELSGMSRIEKAHKCIPHSKIRLLDSIGEGEYGVVYKAHFLRDIRSAPDIIAVKTLKHHYDIEGNSKIIQESLRMIDLDHPNVLGLIGVCVDAGPTPYLLMPFMGHGSLQTYLKKRRSALVFDEDSENTNERSEAGKKLLDMCLQITKGMEYLASKKMIHRDLATRNCMMDFNAVIKVADFGLTEAVYTGNYFRQCKGNQSEKLPLKWMAPESLNDYVFSEASDVWSFGVTCWEVYSGGRNPYPGINAMALPQELEAGSRMNKPLNAVCSDEVYEIMLHCWNNAPSKRPTFSELVVSFTTLLEKVADYLDLTTLPSERCEATKEESLNTDCQDDHTNPQALSSNAVITESQENSKFVTDYEQVADEETRFSS